MISFELEPNYRKQLNYKLTKMIQQYSRLNQHKDFKKITILNLTFRGGWGLEKQLRLKTWSSYEEAIIIPQLVQLGYKCVGCIVLDDDYDTFDESNITNTSTFKTFTIKNRWKMDMLFYYNPTHHNFISCLNELNIDETTLLIGLANETLDYFHIGLLYSYNDAYNFKELADDFEL